MADCAHTRVAPDVYDQTLGVYCLDCRETLGVCWADDHIPESLWNRACENDPTYLECDESRPDVCAICHEPITAEGMPPRAGESV